MTAAKPKGTGPAFDLDKAAAAVAEANQDPFEFTWQGDLYTTPPVKMWDVEIIASAAVGNIANAVRILLGDDQWAAFLAGKPNLGTIEALFEAISAQQGLTPGE